MELKSARWDFTKAKYSRRITCFVRLTMLYLMHPKIQYAFLPPVTKPAVTTTPQCPFLLSFSPATFLPVCVCVKHCAVPGVELSIFLLDFMMLLVAQCSSLSFRKTSHALWESAAPPLLQSSTNLYLMLFFHHTQTIVLELLAPLH